MVQTIGGAQHPVLFVSCGDQYTFRPRSAIIRMGDKTALTGVPFMHQAVAPGQPISVLPFDQAGLVVVGAELCGCLENRVALHLVIVNGSVGGEVVLPRAAGHFERLQRVVILDQLFDIWA